MLLSEVVDRLKGCVMKMMKMMKNVFFFLFVFVVEVFHEERSKWRFFFWDQEGEGTWVETG